MIYILKTILLIWGIKKLFEAVIKEDFGCLYDATLMFAFVFLIQQI